MASAASSGPELRAHIETEALAITMPSAIERPKPRLAPMTMTRLPVSFMAEILETEANIGDQGRVVVQSAADATM